MERFNKKPDLSQLTLREKIGQTAVMQISWFINRKDLKEYLKDNPMGNVWHNGNFCMNTANLSNIVGGTLQDSEYYRNWALGLRDYLRIPPILGLDPVKKGFATNVVDIVNAPSVGATNSEELAYRFGQIQAKAAKGVGANHCWSTMVDMPSRFFSVAIMRAMSDKPDTLCKLAKAMIKGTQDEGALSTAKHFPGCDPYEYRDGHFAPMTINISLEEWKKTQGAVFQEMIDAGVDSIMSSHTAFPAVDNRKSGASVRPATISYNVITKLLKEEMGFKGAVITDSIDMGSLIAAFPDVSDLYVELLNAGNDMLLNVKSYDYIDIIEKAVKDGRISESRIDDACERVLNMKEKIGLFGEPEPVIYNDKLLEEIADFNKTVSERAITLECDIENRLPLDKSKIKNVAIICSTHKDSGFTALESMKESFEKRGMNVHLQRRISSYEERDRIDAENDLIIYAGYLAPHAPMGASSFYDKECETFYYAFTRGEEKSIGVSLGSVYVYYDFYTNAKTFVHAYSLAPEAMEAFVKAIFGEIPFRGIMPYKPAGPRIQ